MSPVISSKDRKPWKKSHFFRGISVKKAELLKLENAFVCGAKSDSIRLLKARKATLEAFIQKSPTDTEVQQRIKEIVQALLDIKLKAKRRRPDAKSVPATESSKHDGLPDLGIKPMAASTTTGTAHLVQGGSPGLGKRS